MYVMAITPGEVPVETGAEQETVTVQFQVQRDTQGQREGSPQVPLALCTVEDGSCLEG